MDGSGGGTNGYSDNTPMSSIQDGASGPQGPNVPFVALGRVNDEVLLASFADPSMDDAAVQHTQDIFHKLICKNG